MLRGLLKTPRKELGAVSAEGLRSGCTSFLIIFMTSHLLEDIALNYLHEPERSGMQRTKIKLGLLPPQVSGEGLAEKGGVEESEKRHSFESDEKNVGMFHALSDRNRLVILMALGTGDLCPCVLADLTEQSNSRLSIISTC
ncbi:MAG: hypothetical protein MZV65_47135 [Chromatiales bacterium]|nr:hypothetical protein [Chromatiales bacterium]